MTTSAAVKALLRRRYAAPEWALFFEVADSTGAAQRRYADAVAMNLFPSRGLSVHGFEIKVSKSDFMNEIRNPKKSAAVQQFCDRWWIVAPENAVDETLLPETWGWMQVTDTQLRIRKEAPKLAPVDLSRQFVAAMVRRASEVDNSEIEKIVALRMEEREKSLQRHIDQEVERRTRAGTEALKAIEDLKKKLGDDESWRYLNTDEIASAVRLVRRAGLTATYSGLRALEKDLQAAAKRVSKALNEPFGEQMGLEAAE